MTGALFGLRARLQKAVSLCGLALFLTFFTSVSVLSSARPVHALGTGEIDAKLAVCQVNNNDPTAGTPIDIAGLKSISLKNNTTGQTQTDTGQGQSFYTLSGGRLSIPNLDAGTYVLDIDYTLPADSQQFHYKKDNVAVTNSAVWATSPSGDCIGQSTNTSANPAASTSNSTCVAGALGWVLCAAIDGLRELTVNIGNRLSNLFTLRPLTEDTPVYTAWNNVRNIANVVFVILFLVLVYSQATGAGLTNLGIKRLLPGLIFGAILVNISYFLCALAVDLSNLFGQAVPGLFGTTATNLATETVSAAQKATGIGLVGVGIVLLVMVALLPIAVLAGATFIVLAARVPIVDLLTITSPFAIIFRLMQVQFFKAISQKWFSWFTGMLVIYPLVMMVFSGATMASQMVSSMHGDSITQLLMAGVIQGIPLVAAPAIAKGASAAFGFLFGLATKYLTTAGEKGKEGYKKTTLGRNSELRKSAKARAKDQRFLEAAATGKGVRGVVLRGRNKFRGLTPTARQASRDYLEQLQAQRQELEDKRTNTMKTAVTREAGLGFAPLIGQMRRGETGSSFASRYLRDTGIALDANQQASLNDLSKRFSSQIGSREFARAALLSAHDLGSDNNDIREATRDYAGRLVEAGMTRTERVNELAGVIAQSAKAGGIMSMSGTGLDASGNYDRFGAKKAPRIIASTDFSKYESGQFGDLRTLATNANGTVDIMSSGTSEDYALAREVYTILTTGTDTQKNGLIRRIAEARGSKAFNDLIAIAESAGVANQVATMTQGFR